MPKPRLAEPFRSLERDIIETMAAGLKVWRPDLAYPQSHSDMQACVRGLLQMFTVERARLPVVLPLWEDATCWVCVCGVGHQIGHPCAVLNCSNRGNTTRPDGTCPHPQG